MMQQILQSMLAIYFVSVSFSLDRFHLTPFSKVVLRQISGFTLFLLGICVNLAVLTLASGSLGFLEAGGTLLSAAGEPSAARHLALPLGH